jgi:hypothetical protein
MMRLDPGESIAWTVQKMLNARECTLSIIEEGGDWSNPDARESVALFSEVIMMLIDIGERMADRRVIQLEEELDEELDYLHFLTTRALTYSIADLAPGHRPKSFV